MPLNNPPPGSNYAAEFSVSPIPWVTSSFAEQYVVQRYDFQNVASSLHVRNHATGSHVLAIGWSRAGVTGSNRVCIYQNESLTMDLRFKTLYVMPCSGSVRYDLLVGLTGIESRYFPDLSGSGYNGVG